MIQLRPAQAAVMNYQSGRLAISAVPGSGKTTTLSLLASELAPTLRKGQVLIVTFSNAAVSNFKHKIAGFLQERRLPRQAGYDVRTLHSLSHLLVQEHAAFLGLDPEYRILDEREAGTMRADAARRWIEHHHEAWLDFIRPAAGARPDDRLRRQWHDRSLRIAEAVIRNAKLGQTRPAALLERLSSLPEAPQTFLARMGAEAYAAYQQQLDTRGAVDFDDLVWLACALLRDNPGLLDGLRRRWPYILEDEAQDSSPLQEQLLEMLAGPAGNWVRVGDPNQAINATFTSADPRFFRRFCRRPDVRTIALDQSGRSSIPIIELANYLVRWTCERHPAPELRSRVFEYQQIRPVSSDDPQPNPPLSESRISLRREYAHWQEELNDITTRALEYAERCPHHTLAILTPTNYLGDEAAKLLRSKGADFDDLLRAPASARYVAQSLALILDFIAEPINPRRLSDLFNGLHEAGAIAIPAPADARHIARLLASARPEALLFPKLDACRRDALPPRPETSLDDHVAIDQFAERVARWVRAADLPADELILTLAAELFHSPFDLAVAQQLAVMVRRMADDTPALRLPDLAAEVHDIAFGGASLRQNSRQELGFEPRKGHITLTTMHSAKGLEWDLVFLTGCNHSWFPMTTEECPRGGPNLTEDGDLEAEVAALTRYLTGAEPVGAGGPPTREAQLELIAERLRLLYVGITRARRHLSISWSEQAPGGDGRYDRGVRIAPILQILRDAEGVHEPE